MSGTSRSFLLRAPASLLTAALMVVVLAGLAINAAVATGPLERLDQSVAVGLNHLISGHPSAVSFWRALTRIGSPVVWDCVATVVVIILFLRRRRRLAVVGIVGLAGAALLSTLLKTVTDRARPRVPVTLDHAAGMSFPSGHAMTSLVAVAFLIMAARSLAPRLVTPWSYAVAGLIVVLIGFSRLVLGVHFMTDVLAGWLAGALWLRAVLAGATRGAVATSDPDEDRAAEPRRQDPGLAPRSGGPGYRRS